MYMYKCASFLQLQCPGLIIVSSVIMIITSINSDCGALPSLIGAAIWSCDLQQLSNLIGVFGKRFFHVI